MNTLKIEAALAKKYGYRPLPADLSQKYRQYFIENIPEFLHVEGSETQLMTMNGTPICHKYDRVVVGDYGAFIEFSEDAVSSEFIIQPGQEYRVNDEKYRKNVKYIWLTINDGSNIKIYKQRRKVSYADYKAKKYYVSVHEVKIGTCKDCTHFIGCGDWNLCCTETHEGYPFGFLCYEDTPACEKFDTKESKSE